MIPRTLQSTRTLRLSRCSRHIKTVLAPLNGCITQQTRSISLESLTTPFSRDELRAAATGNPNLDSEYYLVYVGTLARRIATYKIGAFLLSACGMAIAPVVVATAEVPLMALPVVLLSSLPLLGYHYLARKYVLSMHVYVPPQARSDLRTFTSYVNAFEPGTIVRFRTFRLIFGLKSHVIPVDELKFVSVPGKIQAFEKNVEWDSPSFRSRTLLGKKAWYIQPGLGGQEMDAFWRRIGMDERPIKENRERAVGRMREMARNKVKGLKKAVDTYESDVKEKPRRVRRITMKP